MRIHYIQHVHFEDLGYIADWAVKNGYPVTKTLVYEEESFPDQDDFDLLVIMGGPMGVYEEDKYNWLKAEKEFIKETIESDKKVLGICLGAQLIAESLGAKVYSNYCKEIGWFEVELNKKGKEHPLLLGIAENFKAFHWHGDTFALPAETELLIESVACRNQGFIYKNRVLGLQFHLEITKVGIKRLIDNCKEEIIKQEYIQEIEPMLAEMESNIEQINLMMDILLNNFLN